MADPTLTNIQILRSPVPHKRPDPSLMLDGQLGINYKAVDPGIFTKTVEGTLIKFGPISITNDGLWPNHSTKQDTDGFPGNSHGESWLDGRASFYSPIEKIYDADKDEWVTSSGFTIDNLTGNMTMMKWLTVDRLYANYVDIDGPLEVNGDFLPHGTNCVHSIGTASNRWKGIYSCFLDTIGNLTAGGDADISGYAQIGTYLTVNDYADILGTVTIGTTPASGDTFKVNSPSTFDSTVDIVDNVTAKGLTLSSYLTVKGDVVLGDGCSTTLNVYADTTFHCNVNFVTQPLVLEDLIVNNDTELKGDTIIGSGCPSSDLTVNATSVFNCLTEHEGELRVGRISKAGLRAYGNLDVEGQTTLSLNLTVVGKAVSALTLDSDPNETLTTKSWVKDHVSAAATALGYWQRSGIIVSVKNTGDKVTGTSTVDSDFPTTFVTKDYLLAKVSAVIANDGQINFNAGNGLGSSGTNATADQSGNTTKTFVVKPADSTIIVDASGVKVDTGALSNLNTSGNIVLGDGCATSTINLNGATTVSCDMLPVTDSTINLGSASNRFANIYTGDLHLKNMRGDWTMIEEEDCLTLRNNKTKQRFKISMTPYEG